MWTIQDLVNIQRSRVDRRMLDKTYVEKTRIHWKGEGKRLFLHRAKIDDMMMQMAEIPCATRSDPTRINYRDRDLRRRTISTWKLVIRLPLFEGWMMIEHVLGLLPDTNIVCLSSLFYIISIHVMLS